MYIERDTRKATPGKEQQSGNEYLSKCLTLLIRHTVRDLPAILGKSITLHPKRERERGRGKKEEWRLEGGQEGKRLQRVGGGENHDVRRGEIEGENESRVDEG